MLESVVVSICCVTYNHEPYIAQAIEGFLMQKTDFDYEIIVGEDESQDGTREICIEYARLYPGRICLFLRSRKDAVCIDGRPTGRFNLVENLKAARGKYIALCEGDDYWTDPYKLQKQVDFLESHPECSMCCTNFSMVDREGRLLKQKAWWGNSGKEAFSHVDVLTSSLPATLTVLIRKSALPTAYPAEFFKVLAGDLFLFALVTRHGDLGYLDMNTGCYRSGQQGIWSSLNKVAKLEAQFNCISHMQSYFREPEEQRALKSRLYQILRRRLATSLWQFDSSKLWQTSQYLMEFGPRHILCAWLCALRSTIWHYLSSSPIGPLLRFLRHKFK